MRLSCPPLLLLVITFLCSPIADASSKKRNPIGAISIIRNATIHTPSHKITATSDFDLTFIADGGLHVKFSLEPNRDVLRSNSLITHLAPDGSIERQVPLERSGHKVFKGSAWVRSGEDGDGSWEWAGWVRTLISRDGAYPFFEGAFSVHLDHHHIQSSTHYLQTRHRLDPEIEGLESGDEYMVLWRDSDVLPDSALGHEELRRSLNVDAGDSVACSADKLTFNTNPDHPVLKGLSGRSEDSLAGVEVSHLLRGRQTDSTTGGNSGGVNLRSTIGNPAGCPTVRKVALVGVATDCTYTRALGSSEAVTQNVISQINTASGIWEDAFNIVLGLQNLTISSENCPSSPARATEWNQGCSSDVTIEDRLNWFSAWRGEQGGDNSHWTLLSTCNTDSIIGLAWLGQACMNTAISSNGSSFTGNGATSGSSEVVSGANVVIRTDGTNEWAVIAHETGHTYGAVHDCDSTTCQESSYVSSQQCCPYTANTCSADSRFIMNPYSQPGANAFSPCTIGNICSAIGRNSVNTSCLSDNDDVRLFAGADCGNGIVEAGEECDCGGVAGCAGDPCCDPTTCRFTSGSVCDDSTEECCSNCQFRSSGTVCRGSTSSCDPQEVCSGTSGSCPANELAPNGQDCGDGLKCASGQCTSRNQQCRTVMGSYTGNNDTRACDSSGCMISCASPQFGPGACYGLQQNYLDGTPCGGGGYCQNGQCEGTSVNGEVKSWIDDNKGIVIGVACAVGIILLIVIFGCCSRYRKKKTRRTKNIPGHPAPPPEGWQGWNNRGPMAQVQGPQQGWYGPTPMSGPRPAWNAPPRPPPPSYLQSSNSVRYA
ncbi:Metallo-peptidase family M12-domain-containing protein [Neohortaea acidophila]|uniref:Disintegrin and metalloproteinase domain-containing protein B n=1 Tax=Neohortaea acidophila TaxID=245834 RepID=A0A6A6PGH8_9PEZI|nr:Metallo-peptidase family M12-domain-containing protein [Neohortaea acidophila]KAF2479045.1 Metallo-peptidase family M12-domain-containing protein [Neohortaea acidophila]